MLYLPEKTTSSYSPKLLHAPEYVKYYKIDKKMSNEDISEKIHQIDISLEKEGYKNIRAGRRDRDARLIEVPSSKRKYKEKPIEFATHLMKNSIRTTFIDNRRCYCFHCKKFVIAKVEEYESSTVRWWYDYDTQTFNCPHCGASESYNTMRKLNKDYILYNDCYLDGNKLRLKKMIMQYKQYNNNLFINRELRTVVLNLDTGMAYRLPFMINGKPKKGMKILNVTYDPYSSQFEIGYDHYSEKVKSNYDVSTKAFELIRQYKIEHNGFYIPTKQEQLDFALLNGRRKLDLYNYELKYKKESFYDLHRDRTDDDYIFLKDNIDIKHVIALNRFPAVNVFMKSELNGSMYDYDLNSKTIKKLKKLRGQIKQSSTNPIKDLANKMDIPYTKTLKKFYEKDIKHMIFYKKLLSKNINKDNILKLFNINHGMSRRTPTRLFDLLIDTIDILRKMPKYNENGFINKICKACDDNYHTYNLLCDALNAIINIYSYDSGKDYIVNLKDSIEKIHDTVTKDERKYRNRNITIEYTEEQLKVNGTFNGLNFALAKCTHELIEVGSTMGICVGGYGRRAVEHSCYIVVARNNNGDPIICIEVDRKFIGLDQTKLKFNSFPEEDSEEYKAILQWCNHANMVPNNYEINKYDTTKKFMLDHKDLVEKYNKTVNDYHRINLDKITIDEDNVIDITENNQNNIIEEDREIEAQII